MLSGYRDRRSGVELLKILAAFLIVINHVTQTLGQFNTSVDYHDYVLLLGTASEDVQVVILTLLRQAGALGNTVFFVCSAYFLAGSSGNAKKKAFRLLCTEWLISALFLAVYYFADSSRLTGKDIIKQLFPFFFANNWYVSCYIIFLFVYPYLNRLIGAVDRRQLLRITLFMSALWIVLNYFMKDWVFSSVLLLWVTIYFLIAYLKLYCVRLMADKKAGLLILAAGIFGALAQVLVTNCAGLSFARGLYDKVLSGNRNCCPFFIMTAVGALILALQGEYKSRLINYISSLSLFIYLIHENDLFRTYTRPAVWQYLYTEFGYAYVVLLDLVFSLLLFLASAIAGALYKETLGRLSEGVSDKLYRAAAGLYEKMENAVIKNELK